MTSAPGVAPTPVNVTFAEPPVLSMVSESLNVPVLVGAKVTVDDTDAPGASTAFTAGRPVALNGVAGAVTAVMVRSAPPVLVKATPVFWPLPTGTDPKSIEVGLADRIPTGDRPLP